jgi:hypothetical protein
MNTFTRSGQKIILTKELVLPSHGRYGRVQIEYPKNLVLSLNSLKINRLGTTFIFRVIRAKAVREKYYSDIDLRKIWPNVYFKGVDAEVFLETAEYRAFDEEYLELTTK